MSVVRSEVIDGPSMQATGQHRGTVEVEFSDGRIKRVPVRAADADAWANRIVDVGAESLVKLTNSDAEDGVSADTEIVKRGFASKKLRAVAYLRRAMQQELAYDAFLLFDRFNDYRNAQGWNLNQVSGELAESGLTAEEWEKMKNVYQFLSGAGRPAIMSQTRDIQDQWGSR